MTEKEDPKPEDANDSASEMMVEEPQRSEGDILGDAERVVAAFGGVRPMAARLGVAATTVQGWKSRGHIPENRHDAVLEAAAAGGIDLQAAASRDDTSEASAAPQAAIPPARDIDQAPVQASKQGSGVGALALVVAIAAAVAAVTQPKWAPLVYGEKTAVIPSALESRIAALEGRRRMPDLSPRLAALERALDDVRAQTTAAPPLDLSPRLNALSGRLDELERTLNTARSEGRAAIDSRTADVAALRASIDALSGKVAQAALDTAAANVRKSSVVVAVGALEVALGDGQPYGPALDTVKRLAETDDAALGDALGVLAPYAATGIPTRTQLTQRLAELVATRGTPVWSAGGESWTDKVLRKIESIVSIRRVGGVSDDPARLVRANEALATAGLQGAVAELDGVFGATADWVRDASNRIAADQALAKLRLWAVTRLDASATGKTATQ